MNASGIVTLITDFGQEDPYVGQLKGALLTGYRDTRIVDITHSNPRHDICSAAFTVATSYRFFPHGTVHLVVVDPGVGTDRKILVASANGHYFIAPDNGSLSVLEEECPFDALRQVSLDVEPLSTTFHGRDVMAPVAAYLAGGGGYEKTGPLISRDACVFHQFGKRVIAEDGIVGEVLRIDHFGNIRTSIRKDDLTAPQFTGMKLTIAAGGEEVCKISKTYAENRAGELCALIDSDGFLEIAVNQGSASGKLNLRQGAPVKVNIG